MQVMHMEKMIFACMVDSSSSGLETLTLAASIRNFGGILADCPICALQPELKDEFPKEMKNQLLSQGVKIIPLSIAPDVLKFPFAGYVLAAATIESLVKGKTEFLAWVNSDTLIINEPEHFLLDESKNLGYRPVHHTLVGSIYEKPIDPFWELIYRKCNVSKDKIFPMKTHVDYNTLRPYFNAGCLVVRPEKGLLQSWWNTFKELYDDPSFKEFYKKNKLYSIFIHQAILAGVILSTMEKQELQEFPFTYNYPLHLYSESPFEFQPQKINDLITARYEETEILEKIPFQDPLKSWLTSLLNSVSRKSNNPSKKVKIGRTPLVYPIPIILAGALVYNKPNFETLGDVGIMGINPPIIFISSGQDHYTNIGILKHGNFSINFPSTKLPFLVGKLKSLSLA